ncbi:MAG TPA: MBL fold metallo-hydrolase [Pyrinomonadaceae bacterium]|nr:MBL fold metallo-hydrolase [Pyrinomonadaceae bacterium]
MKEQQIESDIYVFVGETYHSNSTAFVRGDEVLLVDGMASQRDAEALRERIEVGMQKRVRFIVATHYFSDHLAALKLFPRAEIIAHRNYPHTFHTERYRSAEEAANFVEPTMLVSDELVMKWGRYTLEIFHNPGHTMSTLSIEVPEADLLMAGDTVVGNIAYFLYSTPDMTRQALNRLKRRGRSRLISSHQGVRGSEALDNAMFYLDSLKTNVRAAWASGDEGDSVLRIPIDTCLPPELKASPFEKIFHGRNLESVVERRLLVTE